ncbi:late secretory pathway protein AVL9 homolog isoform X3 [Scyliorhinus canicula]|uniref:late secretory pathway protein AVL9 homolog isoform X3 n=1 Tax=Scyliorhinus canicula TaxID=7830 RepID=UPI0018F4CDBF|nr:late secretory pathway protein AVL9 homolog isoform X3 [Scyliorhinus canicula]
MESGAEAAGGGMEPGAEAAACGMEPGADGVVLHIVVVGFHHKKGCQVEFSYPPLVPEEGHDGHSLPEEWKYLPFLALPDGAHNYLEDTVYFHLPPRSGNQKTVYGVSCYRQIEAKPLYGLLQAKLQLITHAYFEEKDFSQISILKVCLHGTWFSISDTRDSNHSISENLSSNLSNWKHFCTCGYPRCMKERVIAGNSIQTIILFKLILLEKKVLFYLSPVNRLVGTLMTVLSLFPGMVEHGLADSSQYKPRKSTSEDVAFQEHGLNTEEYVSISVSDISNPASEFNVKAKYPGGDHQMKVMAKVVTFPDVQRSEQADSRLQPLRPSHCTSSNSSESDWETLDPSILDADNGIKEDVLNEKDNSDQKEVFTSDTLISQSLPITVQPQANTGQTVIVPGLISGLKEDQYGMPLAIFTKGYLCLPYMALQQHHLLSDVTVRGFVAGATNILFRQQKHLSDAVIDIEDAVIQIHDPELRKLLNLTTADLRFADFLVKHVTENRDDIFLDGTGWEGGDEWIRAQFALYIHSLLATTLQPDNDKMLADYGILFITAWKNTHNFRVWNSNKHPAVTELNPGHPFQGQYNVLDVKLRLSHSVQNSERGKKFGNAMISTSRSMVQTGKAVGQSVGGALTSAKSAMTSWFSTFNQQPTTTHSERQSGKH